MHPYTNSTPTHMYAFVHIIRYLLRLELQAAYLLHRPVDLHVVCEHTDMLEDLRRCKPCNIFIQEYQSGQGGTRVFIQEYQTGQVGTRPCRNGASAVLWPAA